MIPRPAKTASITILSTMMQNQNSRGHLSNAWLNRISGASLLGLVQSARNWKQPIAGCHFTKAVKNAGDPTGFCIAVDSGSGLGCARLIVSARSTASEFSSLSRLARASFPLRASSSTLRLSQSEASGVSVFGAPALLASSDVTLGSSLNVRASCALQVVKPRILRQQRTRLVPG